VGQFLTSLIDYLLLKHNFLHEVMPVNTHTHIGCRHSEDVRSIWNMMTNYVNCLGVKDSYLLTYSMEQSPS